MQKVLWTVLSTGLTVVARQLARRAAAKAWTIGTGEEPPVKV